MENRFTTQGVRNIVACTLVAGGGQGLLFNTLNIYVKPVSESIGASRGEFSLYSSIIMLTAVLLLPLFGILYQKKYLKTILIVCSLLGAFATLGFSFSSSLWQFYLFAVILGIGYNGVNFSMAANIINFWFAKNKGLATGISFAGAGFFAAIMVSVLGKVTSCWGWRWSYRIAAGCSLLLTLPAILLLIRIHPKEGEYGEKIGLINSSLGKTPTDEGVKLKEALRMPSFYVLLIGAYLLTALVQGANQNMVAALSDVGFPETETIRAASIALISLGIAKVAVGRILDRIGVVAGVALFGIATAGSFVYLIANFWPAASIVIPILIGVGGGGCQVSLSCLARDFYGGKEFSRVFSVLTMGQFLGTATGAVLPAVIYDAAGSYLPVWWSMLFLTVGAVGLYLIAYWLRKKKKQ